MNMTPRVFPKITAPELRVYLRMVFPDAKFRVQPHKESFSGSTIAVSWSHGPAADEVREAVETLEAGSCLFVTPFLMSGAPGPVLPGGMFFFTDRKIIYELEQSRGSAG